MPRESLRDHLNGNELDLSLSNLTEIPVKEIAAIPKATRLDLSCNSLVSVPSEFCNLTLLVKLDLSKNQLTSLPSSIGKLQKLQHLDLYNNKLSTLPVSMCHLKSLRWLDVKSNPFSEGLLRVAGDCLDDAQCKECAKNVVSYMKKVESEHERQRQKALSDQREQEAKEKAREEAERKKQREKKKLEKERKRREYEAQREAERRAMQEEEDEDDEEEETDMKSNGMRPMPQAKVKKGVGCFGVFISALLGLLAVMVAFCVYCSSHPSDNACILADVYSQQFVSSSRLLTDQLYTAACDGYSSASNTTIHYYSFLRESALHYIDTVKSKLQ